MFLLARVTWEGSSEEVALSGPRGTPCDADTAFDMISFKPRCCISAASLPEFSGVRALGM